MEFRKSWKSRKKDTDEINEKLPEGQEPYDFISEWGPQKVGLKMEFVLVIITVLMIK